MSNIISTCEPKKPSFDEFIKWQKSRDDDPEFPNEKDWDVIDYYASQFSPKSPQKWSIWQIILNKVVNNPKT